MKYLFIIKKICICSSVTSILVVGWPRLDTRCPPKPLHYSLSSAGRGEKNYDEKLMDRDEDKERSL